MSRSVKHTPICRGVANHVSEKKPKAAWHRRFRRAGRQRLNNLPPDATGYITTHRYDVSDPWMMKKEFRCYWLRPAPQDLTQIYGE